MESFFKVCILELFELGEEIVAEFRVLQQFWGGFCTIRADTWAVHTAVCHLESWVNFSHTVWGGSHGRVIPVRKIDSELHGLCT